MGKELSEMTLEELWKLFPIFLVQHDDKWKDYYKEIESSMGSLEPQTAVTLLGIGLACAGVALLEKQ